MTSVRLVYQTTDKVFKFVKTLWTDGQGLWTDRAAAVKVTHISLRADTYNDGKTYYGELRAYFDPKSWNVKTDGLIYTDPTFLTIFKTALTRRGLPAHGVNYSEAGRRLREFRCW
jgi:hypothetical protein